MFLVSLFSIDFPYSFYFFLLLNVMLNFKWRVVDLNGVINVLVVLLLGLNLICFSQLGSI